MSQSTEKQTCRWGFLSTAEIGKKNWLAIKNSGNGVVVAVASRSGEKAQTFIDECSSTVPFSNPPRAVEGYDQLLSQSDIDAVYIPLPTALRKEWVIKAAQAGKHVMCEKPCANHADELAEMTAACEANNVQFMDGVMYMHTQRLAKMREILDDGRSVGEIRRVACQFSFNGGPEFEQGNIRTNSELEPLGCLGDLGWYTIRFILWAMKYEMPERVTGNLLRGFKRPDSPQAVPMEISAELFFKNGVSAVFYNSFATQHQQWANISGTNGHLSVPDFVLPFAHEQATFFVTNSEFTVDGCDFAMIENRTDYTLPEAGHGTVNSQEANLFRNFSKLANSGTPDPHWPQISLKTQQVMDAVMKSASHDGAAVTI